MDYFGSCTCKAWRVRVSFAEPLRELHPRVCDCEYCKAHPSAVTSHPKMQIELVGDPSGLTLAQNGDRLASFHHCSSCADLLAVGCEIKGRLRGAVNALLLDRRAELGEHVFIQPRLLAAADKLLRWEKLWGELAIASAAPAESELEP